MACETTPLPSGGTAILCSRGVRQKRCRWCQRPAAFACDFPNSRRKSGTCDQPFCAQHGRHVGPDRDYCLAHPEEAPKREPEQLPKPEQLPLLAEAR